MILTLTQHFCRCVTEQVLCEISGVDLTHLHVFGCPVGLQNSKLCAALGQFGRIVGSPQQKKYCLRDWK